MITFQQRKELNEISKDVFGKSSFWQNFLQRKGYRRTREEIAQAKALGEYPVKLYRTLETYEELKEEMLKIKEKTSKRIESVDSK